jgi:hypothetical protein
MNHMFLDVEAFRLTKPWLAPLAQVGLVVFNEKAEIVPAPNQGFSFFVSQRSLPDWIEHEAETVHWWHEQEAWPTLKAGMEHGWPVDFVLQQVIEIAKNYDCQSFWFSGPTYDQVMLEAYFAHFGLKCPWEFNQTRDFRTVRKQWPEIERAKAEGAALHDALADCAADVEHMRKIYRVSRRAWS